MPGRDSRVRLGNYVQPEAGLLTGRSSVRFQRGADRTGSRVRRLTRHDIVCDWMTRRKLGSEWNLVVFTNNFRFLARRHPRSISVKCFCRTVKSYRCNSTRRTHCPENSRHCTVQQRSNHMVVFPVECRTQCQQGVGGPKYVHCNFRIRRTQLGYPWSPKYRRGLPHLT